MICIPITATSQDEAIKDIQRCCPFADAVELRMDCIAGADPGRLIAAVRVACGRVKVIVTCRSREESLLPPERTGRAAGGLSPSARMKILRQAAELSADFIDIELSMGADAILGLQAFCRKRKSPSQLIVSWHDISATPSEAKLKQVFRACAVFKPAIVKIVTMAKCAGDNLKVLSLLSYAEKHGQAIATMCMGPEGRASRVAAPLLGSALAFAVLPGIGPSAPGQLTAGAMRELWRRIAAQPVEPAPPPCGQEGLNLILLGNPVRHSLSPLMHNAALKALGLNGHYSAFCATDIAQAAAGLRGMNIRGASVTIPFKRSVMEYLDAIDPDAFALGAVNTIVNDAGCLTGYNTDWLGLVGALKTQTAISGKTFVVLGAGGTARAAAFGIRKEGGEILIANRSAGTGVALAEEFGCPFYSLAMLKKVRADGLINTTPVGMFPDVSASPVEPGCLKRFEVVMDVIYNPLKTKLLAEAEAQGCRIVSGLDMFVHQGAAQFQLWTKHDAPAALMKKVVRERLEQNES